MKKTLTLAISLLITQLTFGQLSTAARYIRGYNKAENKWYYHNFQIGVNMHFANSGMFNLSFYDVNNATNEVYDANYKIKVEAPRMFNAFAASAKPLAALGENSGLALTFGADFSASVNSDDRRIQSSPSSSINVTFLQAYVALPIGLAYRSGGLFTMDKADKMSFSIGMGVAPALTTITLDNFVDRTRFRMPAFITAEVGFFAGINWVVRANVYPGSIHNAFTKKESYEATAYTSNYGHSEVRFSGMGSLMQIGIACMPFSFGWKNSKW